MNATTETTVVAEDAPIGVQLWPTRTPEDADNFTLSAVSVTRSESVTYVTWVYRNGRRRVFSLGEEVAVQITAAA